MRSEKAESLLEKHEELRRTVCFRDFIAPIIKDD